MEKKIYEKQTKHKIFTPGLIIHPKYNWIGATPDGIFIKNKEPHLIEIKCPCQSFLIWIFIINPPYMCFASSLSLTALVRKSSLNALKVSYRTLARFLFLRIFE